MASVMTGQDLPRVETGTVLTLGNAPHILLIARSHGSGRDPASPVSRRPDGLGIS